METWVEELPKKKFFPRVNSEECLVTISMLISNRIDTVEKCFESFRPLLEQIPSEFIAVDTVGDEKSDGSLDIARRYADKIVHFEWCDDFAAARNAGLREARGKWLIYLDDDEWFDDPGPLIDFFSKPELYRNYERVSLMEHSYTTATQIEFIANRFSRICAIGPDSKFVGSVHELLEGIHVNNDYELKNTFVHHVGYMGKLADKKTGRNRKIMDRELAKNPGNLHMWLQQLGGMDGKEDMFKMSGRAIETIRSLKLVDWSSFEWIEIFIFRMKSYARLKKWKELAVCTEEFMDNVKNLFYVGVVAKINLLKNISDFNQSDMCEWLKRYMKAVDYCEKSDSSVDKYTGCFAGDVKKQLMYRLILKYFQLCKEECDDSYEVIRNVFFDIPWKCKSDERKEVLLCSLREAISKADKEVVRFLAKKFNTDSGLLGEFTESLDKIRIELESEIALQSFTEIVSEIDIDDDSLWIIKHIGECVSQKQMDDELSCDVSISGANEGLFELCINSGLSPNRYVAGTSWEEFSNMVYMVVEKESRQLDRIPEFAKKIEKYWEKSLRRDYLLSVLRKRFIFQESMLFSKVMEESKLYCENIMSYAKKMYSYELYQTCSSSLPAEVRFAITFKKALEYRRNKNLKGCLEYLSAALDIFPYSETLIKRIIQSVELEQRRQTAVSDELVRLGNQVKAQITDLISQGQIEVAKGLLDELKQITPNDPDIATLEKLCR